jgi:hypothetical protein
VKVRPVVPVLINGRARCKRFVRLDLSRPSKPRRLHSFGATRN